MNKPPSLSLSLSLSLTFVKRMKIMKIVQGRIDLMDMQNPQVHISVTKLCIVRYLLNALWDLWDWSLVDNKVNLNS